MRGWGTEKGGAERRGSQWGDEGEETAEAGWQRLRRGRHRDRGHDTDGESRTEGRTETAVGEESR